MAIVGDPCNADAHAKIPALFMSMLCPRQRNMSSTVCAFSMYSHLCPKISSLPENVVFSVCERMYNAAHIIFLQHPYDSTGADYKSKSGLACLFVRIR